tara:strand:+ start:545 stop:1186 length:642 start_codon:yes stop_codon:yes gene_type:complete
MANLSLSSTSSTPDNNNLGDNIWYNKGTISAATDKSGQTFNFGNNSASYDLSVELQIDIPGLQYPKTVTVSGNFKKDHQGVVLDWGGAFKVQKVFQAAGLTGDLVDNRLTPETVQGLIGKEVAFINYKNTNGKFSTWNRFYPTNAPKEVIKRDFLKDRARLDKGGYTNNYDAGDSMPNQVGNDANVNEPWMKTGSTSNSQGSLSLGNGTKFMG